MVRGGAEEYMARAGFWRDVAACAVLLGVLSVPAQAEDMNAAAKMSEAWAAHSRMA